MSGPDRSRRQRQIRAGREVETSQVRLARDLALYQHQVLTRCLPFRQTALAHDHVLRDGKVGFREALALMWTGSIEDEAVLGIQNLDNLDLDLDLAHELRSSPGTKDKLAGRLTVDLVVRAENAVTKVLADIDLAVRFERVVDGAKKLIPDQRLVPGPVLRLAREA